MTSQTSVLIVGAGPTGLTAALELGRFGIPFRIVDKYKAPSDTSRALAVQSRTMELMQQRGLAEEMVGLGNKGFFTTMYADGKTLGKVDLRSIDSRFNYTLLLAQSETERILREHVEKSGVAVERETELIAFGDAEGRSGVQAVLRKPDGTLEEVNATYLIASEGAHSLVRHTMDLSFKGESLPHTYALADVHVEGDLPEDQLSIFLAESGLLAAFPMGNRRFRVIATEKQDVARNAPDPDIPYMHELWSKGSHIPVRFYDMIWSSRFRINSRVVEQLRHRSTFLGGDSAHIHSPAGGQGMNTGIQDMINLGWKLAAVCQGHAQESILDTYSEERMPVIRTLVNTTERATDFFNSDRPAVHTLIHYALPVALSFSGIREKGAKIISEQGGNYRDSPLSKETLSGGVLKAGDRFPDVMLDEVRQLKTLDVLDPSAFTVLAFDQPEVSTLRDALQHSPLFQWKDLPAKPKGLTDILGDIEVAVVRPDGYLLSSGKSAEVADKLKGWMAQWLTPSVP